MKFRNTLTAVLGLMAGSGGISEALAIEGYASPELTLDALLLTWPRASTGRRVAA